MLWSVGISYAGISKWKREHDWELMVKQQENSPRADGFVGLTRATVVRMDTGWGKGVVALLLVVIPCFCGRLAFKFDYLYTGLLAQLIAAAYFVWIALAIRFFAPFMPRIGM